MSNHTPTPWNAEHIEDHEGCGCCTKGFDDADKEFIVRACNAHDDLVAALKYCRNLEHLHPATQDVIDVALAKAKATK